MKRFMETGELPSKTITMPALRKFTLEGIDFAFRRMQDDQRHMQITLKCFDDLGYTLPADGSRDNEMNLPGHERGDACSTVRELGSSEQIVEEDEINFATAEELMDDLLEEGCAMPEGEEVFHINSGRYRRQVLPEERRGDLDRVLHAMQEEEALVLPAGSEPEHPRFVIPSVPLRSLLPDVDWQSKIEELPRLAGKRLGLRHQLNQILVMQSSSANGQRKSLSRIASRRNCR